MLTKFISFSSIDSDSRRDERFHGKLDGANPPGGRSEDSTSGKMEKLENGCEVAFLIMSPTAFLMLLQSRFGGRRQQPKSLLVGILSLADSHRFWFNAF
jgi:hypothetical protein